MKPDVAGFCYPTHTLLYVAVNKKIHHVYLRVGACVLPIAYTGPRFFPRADVFKMCMKLQMRLAKTARTLHSMALLSPRCLFWESVCWLLAKIAGYAKWEEPEEWCFSFRCPSKPTHTRDTARG